VQFFQIQINVA